MRMYLTFNQKIFLTISLVYLASAIFSCGYFHFDEHFQILEFLGFKLGLTPQDHLAWEYSDQVRPWLLPFIYFNVSKTLQFIGIESPFIWATIFRLASSFLAITASYQLFLYAQKMNIRFAWAIPFIWFMPMIAARTSGEAISANLTTLILLYYLNNDEYKKYSFLDWLVPIIIGLNFQLRFQIAFIFIGFALYSLTTKQKKISDLIPWSLLVFLGIGFGLLIDYWGYQKISIPPYNYFLQNIVNGVASQFGVSPWWYYFELIIKEVTPFIGIPLILGYFYYIYKNPKSLLTWSTVPFLVIHSLVAHKELRFLFPIAPLAVFMAINTFSDLFVKWPSVINRVGIIIGTINMLLGLQIIFRPIESSVSLYQFVYNSRKINQIVYFENKNPYIVRELHIDYYKKPKIELIPIVNEKSLENLVQLNKHIYVFTDTFDNYFKISSFKICKSIYQTNSTWFYSIDLFQRLFERSSNWSIFECSATE